jgi:hypothetical protein
MKILILTRDGSALGLAQRLVQEGHSVDVYSDVLTLVHTGGSIYDISMNLWKSVQECKFIVTDCGNWPSLYKRASTYNKPIIGCNAMTDMLNGNCVKEYQLGMRLGVNFPKTEVYSDVQGLQPKMLEGTFLRYNIKVDRKLFVCTRQEWMAWAMYQLPIGEEILLQKELKGREVNVIGWFNGLNWVRPFFYATPNSKEIGAVAMLAQKNNTKLTARTIEPLDKWLRAIDYKGSVTAYLLVEDKTEEVYVDRFEIGLTAPCIFAMMESLKSPTGDFLNSLAFGNESEMNASMDYLLGVEVQSKDQGMHGAPVLGLEDGNLKHIFLHGVYKDETGYMMSGETAPIYTAVARGQDVREAARRVYRTIDEVQFPRMSYLPNLEGRSAVTFQNLKSWSVI